MSDAAAIPAGQSLGVDERDRVGARDPAGRGEDGERDRRGVGDRVGAGDPGRVLGRERREAEVLRLLLGLGPWRTTISGAGGGAACFGSLFRAPTRK